jgi:hypothetical protein
VREHVSLERVPFQELHMTYFAFVFLNALMGLDVKVQMASLGKVFEANWALVWLLRRVNSHVLFQIGGGDETLLAVWAFEWTFTCVDAYVGLEMT